MGTHCGNQMPPSYISTSNQMLVVMRTDTMISAKGFKAMYTRACGASIIVKDHGVITSPTINNDDTTEVNCTWTLTAENPSKRTILFCLNYSILYNLIFFSLILPFYYR